MCFDTSKDIKYNAQFFDHHLISQKQRIFNVSIPKKILPYVKSLFDLTRRWSVE